MSLEAELARLNARLNLNAAIRRVAAASEAADFAMASGEPALVERQTKALMRACRALRRRHAEWQGYLLEEREREQRTA